MIQIRFYEDKKTHQMTRIEMMGHAESGEAGQDIVCAGVSSMIISALNYLEELDLLADDQVVADEKHGGYLAVQFFLPEPQEVVFMTNYLLYGLGEIQANYPDYIQIEKIMNDENISFL